MFTAEMMAPCGLDCSLCLFAHNKEKPCPGCNAESDAKPDFCTKWCRIIPCEKRVKTDTGTVTNARISPAETWSGWRIGT